jgi:hypothetical protein
VGENGDELGDGDVVIGRGGGQEGCSGARARGVNPESHESGGRRLRGARGAGTEVGQRRAGAEAPLVDVPPQLLLLLE